MHLKKRKRQTSFRQSQRLQRDIQPHGGVMSLGQKLYRISCSCQSLADSTGVACRDILEPGGTVTPIVFHQDCRYETTTDPPYAEGMFGLGCRDVDGAGWLSARKETVEDSMFKLALRFPRSLVLGFAAGFTGLFWLPVCAIADSPIRVGVIGLDAHAVAWQKLLAAADEDSSPALASLRIVAAVPAGSEDIPEKKPRLAAGIEHYRSAGIRLCEKIDELLPLVDAVMILSADGRAHLDQARPVIANGKPLFIDKPMAASVEDAREIFRLAEAQHVPVFSSSSLRFAPKTVAVVRDQTVGSIIGCDAHSPCQTEPHHPDLFWYGIHGVEALFTIMGPGCDSVSRTKTDDTDFVVGRWRDGRIGTFRGHRSGPHSYGATVFGSKGQTAAGTFEGYEPLLAEITQFFRTGDAPVQPEETLEILAFMEAADASGAAAGAVVPLQRFGTAAP